MNICHVFYSTSETQAEAQHNQRDLKPSSKNTPSFDWLSSTAHTSKRSPTHLEIAFYPGCSSTYGSIKSRRWGGNRQAFAE